MGPSNFGGSGFNQAPRPVGNFEPVPEAPANVEQTPGNIEATHNLAPTQVEAPPAAVEVAPPVPQALPATPPPTDDSGSDNSNALVPPVATITTKSSKKEIAELEKLWVGKAKTVVVENRYNPYEQAHQIAMLVQGYLQARYGKQPSKK